MISPLHYGITNLLFSSTVYGTTGFVLILYAIYLLFRFIADCDQSLHCIYLQK